jgi:hypothetical protein
MFLFRNFILALILIVLVGLCEAQCTGSPNCTVKQGGGGGYTTIQACATAMANGDTCTVFAATYNENVTFSAGGVGSYKTIKVNGSDLVQITGTVTVNSHTKLLGNCPALTGSITTLTCGFFITNPSSPTSTCVSIPSGSTDFFIVSNVMYACGGLNEGTGSASSHGFIQGNTISYPYTTSGATQKDTGPAIVIYGNFHLIENNDISHTSDGFHYAGSHNIVRKNTMHDTLGGECVNGGNGGNCHIDFIECEPVLASQFNVYEANVELNNLDANTSNGSGPISNGHGFLVQADICAGNCFNTILRFNSGAHVGGGSTIDDNAGNGSVAGYSFIKVYNNTWADFVNDTAGRPGGSQDNFSHNSGNGAALNNIYYWIGSFSDMNAYGVDASSSTGFTYGHSLAFCTGSPCTIHSHTYGSGSFTSDPGNVLGSDPLFLNYGINDLHLTSLSPARGAGTFLTTANGAGTSSTSLTVTDASFFQDGYGIVGVQPDCLRIGASTTVCIAAGGINYSTNVITLASAVSWNNADGIYLYKDSSGNQQLFAANPDMGAFQFSANPPLPGVPAPWIFARVFEDLAKETK